MSEDRQCYVYALCHPDGTPFYIGKGSGNRIDQHERRAQMGDDAPACAAIRSIWAEGGQVIRVKLATNLANDDALQDECRQIARYRDNGALVNVRSGWSGNERHGKYRQVNLTLSVADIQALDGWRDTRLRTRSAVLSDLIYRHEQAP